MNTLLVPLLGAALFATAADALALAGSLKEPGIAFSQDYPEAARKQVMAALERPDCKFLKGNFINWHTSLLYAGETKALNLFLDGLAKCPGVTLHVSFVADPIPGEACDWVVAHDAHANRFHVRVNLKSERIKLPDLYLPEVKGPAVDFAPRAAAPAARSPISEASAGADAGPAALAVAAKRGEAAAAADLKAGQVRLLHYGKPWSQGKPLVDDATGCRVEVLAGCVVTGQFVAEVDAYNRTVREWHARQVIRDPGKK